eukprot:m.213646 g.213646  ORF g.213646 m.213646 type:complete len:64 (-) comp15578_c2_seq6:21-212(-)
MFDYQQQKQSEHISKPIQAKAGAYHDSFTSSNPGQSSSASRGMDCSPRSKVHVDLFSNSQLKM